jgi:predicted transcriptional regulator
MARKESRTRGSLEREVLMCLAAAGRPLTVADVQAEIGGLAYTTVMTTLSRLHGKGAIGREQRGRAYEYSLVGGTEAAQSNMTAHQMLKLLDDEADRTSVLTRFVAELKPEDERLLTDLLGWAPGARRPKPRPTK